MRLLLRTVLAVFLLQLASAASFAAPYPREKMATVLFPILLNETTGAGGTAWWADNYAHNVGEVKVPFHVGSNFCGIAYCEEVIPPRETERVYSDRPRITWDVLQGVLAYVDRELASNLVFSYRLWLRDATGERPIAEVPVVSESDLFRDRAVLTHVPVNTSSRITLRIYDVERNTPNRARLVIRRAYPRTLLVDEVVALRYDPSYETDFPDSPGYLQINDLARTYPQLAGTDAIEIEIEKIPGEDGLAFWMFASVTENATNAVVLYTPNRAK